MWFIQISLLHCTANPVNNLQRFMHAFIKLLFLQCMAPVLYVGQVIWSIQVTCIVLCLGQVGPECIWVITCQIHQKFRVTSWILMKLSVFITLPFSNNRLQNSAACHNIFNYIFWTHCGSNTKIVSHNRLWLNWNIKNWSF